MSDERLQDGSRRRALVTAGVALVVLALAGLAAAVAMQRSGSTRPPAAPRGAEPAPAESTATAEPPEPGALGPGATVASYHEALRYGDYAAAKGLLTGAARRAFDPGSLASQDREIMGLEQLSESAADSSATVVVRETSKDSAGVSFSATVTFRLSRSGSRWAIDSIERGREAPLSGSGDAGEPREGGPAPPAGPTNEEKSVEVVGEFLYALQEGRFVLLATAETATAE